jgi:hypothetical protein
VAGTLAVEISKVTLSHAGYLAAGMGESLEAATAKAESELLERITTPSSARYCSSGCHPELHRAQLHAYSELVERDAIVAFFTLHRSYCTLEVSGTKRFIQIPCPVAPYFVVLCEKSQGTFREYTSGCAATLEAAKKKADLESNLRPLLDSRFEASRLPTLVEVDSLPELLPTAISNVELILHYLENRWICHILSDSWSVPWRPPVRATLERFKCQTPLQLQNYFF